MGQLLEGLQVLVTRPATQADHLCELLETNGADSHALPVMEISPHESTESIMRLRHISAWDMVIFVSRNAVEFALPYLDLNTLPKVVAIGRKTAEFAARQGIRPEVIPPRFNSESLLAMPVMQAVTAKRILIVRGCGGREKLADTLKARGAVVDYAEVYRRSKLVQNAARLQTMLANQDVDLVTVASGDAMQNLIELSGEQKQELIQLPVFVMSQRVAKLAQKAGFADTGNIYIATEASDEGLVEAIMAWHQHGGVSGDTANE